MSEIVPNIINDSKWKADRHKLGKACNTCGFLMPSCAKKFME